MTSPEQADRTARNILELVELRKRLTNIRNLIAQHPEHVPTAALRDLLDAPVHTEEKS